MQLNKSEVSPGVMDVLADGTAKPAPHRAPVKKSYAPKRPRQTDISLHKAKCRWGEGRIYRSPDTASTSQMTGA